MASFDHGFSIVENCYTPSECDLVASHVDGFTGPGTRCLLDNGWCQSLAGSLQSRMVASVPELELMVAVQCTFFNKSPSSNWFVGFHQDRSVPVGPSVSASDWPGWSQKEGMTFVHGPDELLDQMVALRLHVDDSTTANGPLRVIPDSHRSGTICAAGMEVWLRSAADCPLTVKRGGVIAMRPLLLHASSKSRTMQNRRVLHFLFGPRKPPAGLEWRRAV